jgi:hypothetical protein
LRRRVDQTPDHRRSLEPPAHEPVIDLLPLNVAIVTRGAEELLEDVRVVLLLPGPSGLCQAGLSPEFGHLEKAHKPRARTTGNHVIARLASKLRPRAEDQVLRCRQLLVGREGPALVEVAERAGACLVLLRAVEIPRLQAEAAPHFLEHQPGKRFSTHWAEPLQGAVQLGELRFVSREVAQALVVDRQQAELVEIGVVEAPPLAQVAHESVPEDEANGSLALLTREPDELRTLEILDEHRFVAPFEAQRLEHQIGQVLFRQGATRGLQRGDQGRTQGKQVNKVVEVAGLQCGVLPVVGEAEELARIGQARGQVAFGKELSEQAQRQNGRRGRTAFS